MKKIMFNDKYGLTKAVLDGRKTMTRRIINAQTENWLRMQYGEEYERWMRHSPYMFMEQVSIAQSYSDIYEELKRTHGSSSNVTRQFFHKYIQGGRMPVSNKMFVKAEPMPHHIRITDIKIERLQDISEEDCMKEGIIANNAFEIGYGVDFVYEFKKSDMCYFTPREAFAALIDKVSGRGTWESNPYVFAYSFKLVD